MTNECSIRTKRGFGFARCFKDGSEHQLTHDTGETRLTAHKTIHLGPGHDHIL